MAQIQTETLVITFSKLVKTGEEQAPLACTDVQVALEHVAQELVGTGIVVEIERA